MENIIIGGLSGMISRTATAPLELVKIQQQNKFVPYSNVKDVIRKEGLRGLWKGNLSNCVRIFPQMGINYGMYNIAKNTIDKTSIKNDNLKNFISGSMAGTIAMTAVYPLENIRSRLSLQTNKNHYSGIVDVFKKTPLRTLYYGLRMSIYGYTPYNGLSFMFYENMKKREYNKLVSGGLAGVFAVSFTYPTDLIRRRLQIQGLDPSVPKYNGIVDCVKKIYKYEGIRGFYRGLIPCYIKIFPSLGIQFYMLDFLKNNMKL